MGSKLSKDVVDEKKKHLNTMLGPLLDESKYEPMPEPTKLDWLYNRTRTVRVSRNI
uniref:Uncharacterized protein n=1 Tax=Pithovirus LCPAC101 TaxID=2506586 RepID=A0A481Z229_9VIRU|nr:MAG: hypothetical protein LCPAC101_00060 [Pithovirus LCPAC101]